MNIFFEKSFIFLRILISTQALIVSDLSLTISPLQGIGVDMAEFRRISSWVSQKELSDHVARVLYVLLDEDGDGRLFNYQLINILINHLIKVLQGGDRAGVVRLATVPRV